MVITFEQVNKLFTEFRLNNLQVLLIVCFFFHVHLKCESVINIVWFCSIIFYDT